MHQREEDSGHISACQTTVPPNQAEHEQNRKGKEPFADMAEDTDPSFSY